MTPAPLHSQPGPRPLSVLWCDQSWIINAVRSSAPPPPASSGWKLTRASQSGPGIRRGKRPPGFAVRWSLSTIHYSRRAFTVLEMLVVITIIGFLAAVALPHVTGMTRANSMTTALQQMLGDCALARQLAMSHRSTVFMVFVPPNFSAYGVPINEKSSYTNLLAHQYGAYALVSLRSVGDQPGRATPQYLTEWKPLPDGVFIAPFKFTNQNGVTVYSTNTLSNTRNVLPILQFPSASFPFPAADARSGAPPFPGPFTIPLPYIAFSPLGQLATNDDEYIPLARGRVLYPVGAAPPVSATAIETPPGNDINNCNIIHIDWLTARAKIERNQQR